MTRAVWLSLWLFCGSLLAEDPPVVQEPPEEDVAAAPKTYSFNPLQAEKEKKIGNFYFKKGSYKAAARRFEEATKWNPQDGDAFLKLGDALFKSGDKKGGRDAYRKFLDLDPKSRDAAEVKKKLGEKS